MCVWSTLDTFHFPFFCALKHVRRLAMEYLIVSNVDWKRRTEMENQTFAARILFARTKHIYSDTKFHKSGHIPSSKYVLSMVDIPWKWNATKATFHFHFGFWNIEIIEILSPETHSNKTNTRQWMLHTICKTLNGSHPPTLSLARSSLAF